MKAIEHYFHVVTFIMLYKVVLTFEFVDETLACVMRGGKQNFVCVIFKDSRSLVCTFRLIISDND